MKPFQFKKKLFDVLKVKLLNLMEAQPQWDLACSSFCNINISPHITVLPSNHSANYSYYFFSLSTCESFFTMTVSKFRGRTSGDDVQLQLAFEYNVGIVRTSAMHVQHKFRLVLHSLSLTPHEVTSMVVLNER